MHLATFHHPVTRGHHTIPAGRFLLEDHNAAEFLHAGRGDGSVQLSYGEAENTPATAWRQIAHDSPTVLVSRIGGFGDLLWLNAVYQAMKAERPDLRIAHACFPVYAPVLQHFADEVVPYPLSDHRSADYDAFYWLENLIEGRPCVDGEHPCDRMAATFGLLPLARKAAYHVTNRESKTARNRWPRTPGVPRVCLQVESSTGNKSYPHLQQLLDLLTAGLEVVVVGGPSPNDGPAPGNVFNCRKVSLGIRESIAMASHCDVIVGSDSVFVHVGAALDIPVVGLFGPFDAASYMTGQRGTPLQGRLPCSPCHWHPRAYEFPPDQPCTQVRPRHCLALGAIKPQEVLEAVYQWVE
jgi:ADP-heptose:LPS heptosyltransferase